MNKINEPLFYINTSIVYPPFKNGLYMEEYFLNYMEKNNKIYDKNGRLFIPSLWTNFQIERLFYIKKQFMQQKMNEYIKNNHCENGYFIVVQMDDGPLLKIPENTLIYGACFGNIPLPLIYQDNNNTLITQPIKSFNEKQLLCSFIGSNTHNVRSKCIEKLEHNINFSLYVNNGWTNNIEKDKQDNFINITLNSKFSLAPRGYGRSSFRFFEIFQLGTIPIYIWDDIEWLPYKEILDYDKFCISINISQIENLENILLNIDETQYNNMKEEYEKIKYMFELEYMCKYITE